jgi:hypothetical protein
MGLVSMISRTAFMRSQVLNQSKRFSLISLVLVLLIRVVSRLTTQLDCTDNQTGYPRYTIYPKSGTLARRPQAPLPK